MAIGRLFVDSPSGGWLALLYYKQREDMVISVDEKYRAHGHYPQIIRV